MPRVWNALLEAFVPVVLDSHSLRRVTLFRLIRRLRLLRARATGVWATRRVLLGTRVTFAPSVWAGITLHVRVSVLPVRRDRQLRLLPPSLLRSYSALVLVWALRLQPHAGHSGPRSRPRLHLQAGMRSAFVRFLFRWA